MKILVTGGAGYIGSHTCKALAEAGHEVVVYDNLSTGFRALAQWGDFVHGDILDGEALRACLRRHKPEGLIHFAAFSQVGESVADPGKYIHNNVGGTLSILESMRDTGVRNIVVSSTAAVYGMPDICPLTEDAPASPINPYGETKLFMEWMLADYARAFGLSWTALRYFNAAGADPDGDCGECHDPETHLIPRALMAVTGELKDFRILGKDYPTPDGTCIRDYIHVSDLALAHVRAMERLHEAPSGQGLSLNLGSGAGFSVQEIVNAVEKVTQRPLPHTIGERRPGDPPVLVADGSAARNILGWVPRTSDLDVIISSAWNWLRSPKRAAMLSRA